jgi:hypothetical protein
MTGPPRFHLAIPVDDLDDARAFYGGVLGCEQGREDEQWVDWNLYGHQVVTHLARRPEGAAASNIAAASNDNDAAHNAVDGHDVPVPHFGVILPVPEFHVLSDRLRARGVTFVIEPYVRFEGQPGEQWTMFFRDPAGNALEIKAFADDGQVFAT